MSVNEIPCKVNHLRDVDSIPPVDVDWLWFDRIGYVEIHFRFLEQSLIIKKEMAFRWDREELGLGEFVRNLYEFGSAAAPNIGSSWMFVREGVNHVRRGPGNSGSPAQPCSQGMASYAKDLQPPGDANHYIVKAIKDELSPDTRPAQEIARVTAPQQVQSGLLPPNYSVEATRQ